ncbi:Hypothetical protein R9X50_00192200 [Acrodontium crateriforme]|uniref:Zn(2)-C6 fungal-type domain-containing protein n=1 Tax=Acrodontium crateriforme TaxID=150365 RepID=A0AAQ3RAH1_9PEZI|nr:Hypothetical protein R9X50_00192200 [Acrodontium crateriforme]
MTPPSPSSDKRPSGKKRRRTQVDTECRSNTGDEDGPACQSCRKRKAKCSRDQPCSQCERLGVECEYDERRKPGMKTGAIEALNQRLSSLEHMFIGQGLLLKPFLAQSLARNGSQPEQIATNGFQDNYNHGDSTLLTEQTAALKQQYSNILNNAKSHGTCTPQIQRNSVEEIHSLHGDSLLPPEDVMESLIGWYFTNIHRWIPILHVRRFREVAQVQPRPPGVSNILHAITSLCVKFHLPRLENASSIALRCRHAVILRSTERFSVENLQALIIIAFDIIASGRGPSAWSVVGSMTRTVEQLRLSTEEPENLQSGGSDGYLFRRMNFLAPARTWAEEEERRRVFWVVFALDRLCSVSTGWNNSLTCADVRRRLPCEGATWEIGEPVEAPFFGIAERPSKTQKALTPDSERHVSSEKENDALGGFAFCIEATETLNLVTSFFLECAIEFKDSQNVQVWLMRFKELDLRLVKWRLFLPPKWRNASVLNDDGVMDPNLTLAHITHNTAVIQLHQNIAFPSPEWRTCQVTLPSTSSLEACITAACEIGSIAQQFMQQNLGLTHPQLSICLFIAGRMLLVYSSSTGEALHPAFGVISTALSDTAQLWSTANGDYTSENSLASRLSKRLSEAEKRSNHPGAPFERSADLDIRQPVYNEDTDTNRTTRVATNNVDAAQEHVGVANHAAGSAGVFDDYHSRLSPESLSMAFPPMPAFFDQYTGMSLETPSYSGNGKQPPVEQGRVTLDGLDDLFNDEYPQITRVSMYKKP